MKQDFEIINQANGDYFDLLDENALDLIRGGTEAAVVKCGKGYSEDGGTIKCSCSYSSTVK
jgi:hypothetical protein